MQLQQFLRYYDRDADPRLPAERLPPPAGRQPEDDLRVPRGRPRLHAPSFERERHATARKTRATRLAARMERMSKSRRGRPAAAEALVRAGRAPAPAAPDRAARRARGARRRGNARAARGRRAPARAGRPRLRGLVDLRDMSGGPGGRPAAGRLRRRPRIPAHLATRVSRA